MVPLCSKLSMVILQELFKGERKAVNERSSVSPVLVIAI